MIRKVLLAAVLLAALPLVAGSSSAAPCTAWNAASKPQHHKAGPVDIVGGHGYGSGYHSAGYYSPPQPLGAYGDPKRRGAQGGYIQYQNKPKTVTATVYLFGPFDETDTSHNYDTVYGACVSIGNIGVDTKPKCIKTSSVRKPAGWKSCKGY